MRLQRKIRLLLTISALLFLTACVKQTVNSVSPVDWDQVRQQVAQLTQPTKVSGDIQHRYDASTTGDLWTYAGRSEDAVDVGNNKLASVAAYIDALAELAEKASDPACQKTPDKCNLNDLSGVVKIKAVPLNNN